MDKILKQNDLNCEHIAKIVVELAPKYRYTYIQLYFIIYNIIRDFSVKPEDITKQSIIDFIEEYRKDLY